MYFVNDQINIFIDESHIRSISAIQNATDEHFIKCRIADKKVMLFSSLANHFHFKAYF